MVLPDQSDAVELEVRIAARPEVVFQFFIDPAKMMQWKGVDVALDPRPGGIYHANINGRDKVRGEYLEIVPHSRIVFTWGWESGPITPGATKVEVTLVPDGEGTLVKLRHSGLAGEAAVAHRTGWEHYLPRLIAAAEGRPEGPDPWAQPPAPDAEANR